MKTKIISGLIIMLGLTVSISYAQEFTFTTTTANIVASKATIDNPGLTITPLAIIVATPLGDTAKLNPHPIGAWYYNNKWNIFNTDHAQMPVGAKFAVQYFPTRGTNQFLHIVSKQNLGSDGSYIDSPVLNNNPKAQIQIFQNHAPDNRSGFYLNNNEVKFGYDAVAGKWYIANLNGKPLNPNTAYNIVITSGGTDGSTTPASPEITSPAVTPAISKTPIQLPPMISTIPATPRVLRTTGQPPIVLTTPTPLTNQPTKPRQLTVDNSNELEVSPKSKVGTPDGPAIKKSIGPAGDSIASADGRITINIPSRTLSAQIVFTIQPIINQAEGGFGNAYRLGPDGQKFTTPVEISIRYDERDLEGTAPEALSLAFRNQQGEWLPLKSTKHDRAAKTISFSTTHFTDVSFGTRIRTRPLTRTLRVGESQFVQLIDCKERTFIDRIVNNPEVCTRVSQNIIWSLRGEGRIETSGIGVIYTAPAKKPTPNKAFVFAEYRGEELNREDGRGAVFIGNYYTVITILERGYKVVDTGVTGVKLSGVICSLEKPFTILMVAGVGVPGEVPYAIKFDPVKRTASFDVTIADYPKGTDSGLSGHWTSNGSYTVKGADTDKVMISWVQNNWTMTLSHKDKRVKIPPTELGRRTIAFDLVPLDTGECN